MALSRADVDTRSGCARGELRFLPRERGAVLAERALAKGGFRRCRLRYILLGCLLPLLIGGDYIQRDRRVHDPLRMGIGRDPVHAGEEAILIRS